MIALSRLLVMESTSITDNVVVLELEFSLKAKSTMTLSVVPNNKPKLANSAIHSIWTLNKAHKSTKTNWTPSSSTSTLARKREQSSSLVESKKATKATLSNRLSLLESPTKCRLLEKRSSDLWWVSSNSTTRKTWSRRPTTPSTDLQQVWLLKTSTVLYTWPILWAPALFGRVVIHIWVIISLG